mgnify:FL=1|jgi:hypothetical protein|tara:strand:- start:622 stop:1098 length:477 start_codon:yes stop_codon:yes gene_type:complete
MIKNIKTIIGILLPIVLLSCGFSPVSEKNSNIIYLQNINVEGERRIAYSLKNNILLVSNNNSKNKYDAKIKITQKKNQKIKDSKGKITRFNLTLTAKLVLTNLDNKTKIEKTFIRNRDYDVSNLHSKTINNEDNAVKNIIEILSDDMVNFIKLSMRNK